MAEEKVLVKYIDSALAAQNGSQSFRMGLHLARQWEDKGWIRILDKIARANPSVPIDKDEVRNTPLIKMLEEENLTKIAWVTSDYIDAAVRKVGAQCGFQVEHFSASVFSSGLLMKTKLMIVESNMKGFTPGQLENLRCIQFQKGIPFIFRIVGYDGSEFFQQGLIHSRLNVFASAQLFEYACDLHENLIEPWFIESKSDHFAFWRAIEGALNVKPKEAENGGFYIPPAVRASLLTFEPPPNTPVTVEFETRMLEGPIENIHKNETATDARSAEYQAELQRQRRKGGTKNRVVRRRKSE
jgi:hypothetical protein